MHHHLKNLILIACVLTFLAGASLGSAAPADHPQDGRAAQQAANLLPNPSFETQTDGQPAGWKTQTWGGEGTFGYADIGRTGKRSLTIGSQQGADVGWSAIVKVEPNATYRLSAWIKTEDVRAPGARGALLNLHNLQGVVTNPVTGTKDWTKVEVVFDTTDQDQVQVNCLFGGWGLATGKAWYDDVRLERLATQAREPKIAIDAGRTGEPISKYIYGQFIEHLGRCIYGGIWAEMLEDRKFYFPITAKYNPYRLPRDADRGTALPVVAASPWEIIGPADSVKMVKEDSFVGEHTPLIAPGGGIRQRDLGLVKGKEYVVSMWLKSASGASGVEVSIRWGEAPEEQYGVCFLPGLNGYEKRTLSFTSGADTNKGVLEIRVIPVKDGGPYLVGAVSLMPADNVEGMRADTLAVLKELDAPVYRWPGGNFVSGYDWKDGIGQRDRRPPRKNPAWTGVEHNDFGLDEFMTFCRLLGTEPLVVVNSGLGKADSAVEELQYANGGPSTPMGKLRANNGHPDPYGVKWWAIGNEMYGNWQLGHVPLADYMKKHNEFADAMRAVDPSIKLVGVGAVGQWSEGMMQSCADHMDLVSEHFYVQERPTLAAHVRQAPDRVRAIAEAHRRYRQQFDSLKGKDIRIALDEWNHWYGPHVFGELGTRYFLKDGLGIAAGLNEFTRNSDIYFMGNYAQTVNVIGCIKTSKTAAALETTGLVLKLYRKHFGVLPVKVTAAPPLDVVAAWSEDRKTLTMAVVNPTMNKLEVPLEVEGAKLSGAGRRWQIAGDDPMAYNEPGKQPKVTIEETAVTGVSGKLSVAPCSVTLYALDVE